MLENARIPTCVRSKVRLAWDMDTSTRGDFCEELSSCHISEQTMSENSDFYLCKATYIVGAQKDCANTDD
eukprot:1145466-Amphidinium_carterae.1